MFKNKYLILAIVLIMAIVLVGGCGKKKAPEAGVPARGGEVTTPEKPTEGVEMTDDLYIELTARQYYEVEKNPNWIIAGWPALLKENGISEDQYGAFVEKAAGDTEHYLDLTERIQARLNELKAGEKEEPKKEEPVAEKTPVEKYYDKIKAVEPTAKTKSVHEEILPVFKKVFGDEVKLKEDFGGAVLTYVVNRVITSDDVTAVRTELEAGGEYEARDVSAKQLTMSKVGRTLVISFRVDKQDRATIDVSL